MSVRVFIIVLFATLCASCTQKLICPAYQSAFIHDKPTQRETFVYYNENKDQSREIVASNSKTITLPARIDSIWSKSDATKGPALPKEKKRKKGRYLLLPERTYKQVVKSLQTIPMKPVYPTLPTDSSTTEPDIAGAEMDSVALAKKAEKKEEGDSVYVISKAKEKFNLDQDNYMWYFREILVLPDVRLAMNAKDDKGGQPEKKEKGGFFKNLFKKKVKSKTPQDSSKAVNVNDSTAVTPAKDKKGLGGLFKKKPKSEKTTPVKKDPAKKEDDDDGF